MSRRHSRTTGLAMVYCAIRIARDDKRHHRYLRFRPNKHLLRARDGNDRDGLSFLPLQRAGQHPLHRRVHFPGPRISHGQTPLHRQLCIRAVAELHVVPRRAQRALSPADAILLRSDQHPDKAVSLVPRGPLRSAGRAHTGQRVRDRGGVPLLLRLPHSPRPLRGVVPALRSVAANRLRRIRTGLHHVDRGPFQRRRRRCAAVPAAGRRASYSSTRADSGRRRMPTGGNY
mmetsp:Transcript_35309/g.73931  ORF Transcript_35309/g.73931 Transcript_35309/m.73931 type:complete len:230 (+) Transcript_35309:240-929(+)